MNRINILIGTMKILIVIVVISAFITTVVGLYNDATVENMVPQDQYDVDLSEGWEKFSNHQILGDEKTGTLFDPDCIIEEEYENRFRMYVSKRNNGSIVLFTSEDGINFNPEYKTIIAPEEGSPYIYIDRLY